MKILDDVENKVGSIPGRASNFSSRRLCAVFTEPGCRSRTCKVNPSLAYRYRYICSLHKQLRQAGERYIYMDLTRCLGKPSRHVPTRTGDTKFHRASGRNHVTPTYSTHLSGLQFCTSPHVSIFWLRNRFILI